MDGKSEMWQRVWAKATKALAATALLTLALAGNVVGAAAQTGSPVDVVKAFIDAGNSGDLVAMGTLADPSFGLVEDPHQTGSHTENLADLESHLAHVTILSAVQTGPDSVTVDANLSGRSLPPLKVPFHITYAVQVAGGRVLHMAETVAPETLSALRSLGPASETQPGMPSTGSASDGMLITLLGLGLAASLSLAGGVLARHRGLGRS